MMNYNNTFKSVLVSLLLILFNTIYTQETNFTNGIDDDADGFIDCGDTDAIGQEPCQDAFVCSNTLYQVITNSLKKLDPLTGNYDLVGNSSSSFNGAGYNVQDGFIYGIKSSSDGKHLWKINNAGQETDQGVIANWAGRTYVGDFDETGNLHTYTSGSNPSISYVDVDNTPLASITQSLTNISAVNSIPGVADITYNPVFKKFYGMSGGLDLIELDHQNLTADVIADFTGQLTMSGGFGAAWSDIEGNSYFSNNATGKIVKVTFDAIGNPLSITHVATGQPTNSNDGMGCFLSLPPFETDCGDGIDNDGDGLIDCADPDCSADTTCPFITSTITGNEQTGPNSITPIHITLINSSSSATEGFSLSLQLPDGFSYLSDSLEYIGNANFNGAIQPIEGATGEITWSALQIAPGDSMVISVGLLVDSNILENTYNFTADVTGVIMKPYSLSHDITVLESLFYDAEALSCEPAFYQVYKKKGEPNIYGKLNVSNQEYDQISVIDAQLNGLGFDPNTEYAYGSNGTKFIRLDQTGNATYLNLDFAKKVYVGDVDNSGYWYGKVGSDIVKVNIENATIENTFTSQGLPGWDMAFNKDGNFYAAHKDDFYKFNTTTNQKESLGKLTGTVMPNSGHGAQWTGKDGFHYISNNASGKIFRVNVETLETAFVMQATPGLQFNDGFSCPTEIPVVFEYDYGDYSLFPQASQWMYADDQNNDNIPDYDMVWIGSQIISDRINPANATASGETDDDELITDADFIANQTVNIEFTLNSNVENSSAYWGMWIDWNEDGNYDTFVNGVESISGVQAVTKSVLVPNDISSNVVGIRIRTSQKTITEDLFRGEMTEPGEIEDHVLAVGSQEICGNNIDDDNDGLTDCDDPDCVESCDYDETTSSQEGGLESNRRLSHLLAQRNFENAKNGNKREYLSKENLEKYSGLSNTNARSSNYTLENFIPTNAIEGTESYINSPVHLIELTNAVELFSVDIFSEDRRVAAVLALETENNVYEHSKYICDRLSGAEIMDIFNYTLDNNQNIIIAKIKQANGDIEYASSISLFENTDSNFNLESFWNLDSYTKNQQFLNFQVWANNTSNLISLINEIIRLSETIRDIDQYATGNAPEFFIQSGTLNDDQLSLNIKNKAGINSILATGDYTETESQATQQFDRDLVLSGNETDNLTIDVGSIYDLGLTFYNPALSSLDVIFLADGTWGAQAGTNEDQITEYTINSDNTFSEDNYELKRNVSIRGTVKNYINIYRSLNARFSVEDLQRFQSFNFIAFGNAKVEVSILKESVSDWELQAKKVIQVNETETQYALGKDFFRNALDNSQDWNDAYLIVFNILGNQSQSEAFTLELKNVEFSNALENTAYLIFSDQGLLQNTAVDHQANIIDGTDMQSNEISSQTNAHSMFIYIENLGNTELVIDDLEIVKSSDDFMTPNFEPTVVNPGEIESIEFIYKPQSYPSEDEVTYNMYIQSDSDYSAHSISLKASSACVLNDVITTVDQETNRPFKAIESIISSADISEDKTIIFSAGGSIELEAGFNIEIGAEVFIEAENRCEN